jgi:hypothetical protein
MLSAVMAINVYRLRRGPFQQPPSSVFVLIVVVTVEGLQSGLLDEVVRPHDFGLARTRTLPVRDYVPDRVIHEVLVDRICLGGFALAVQGLMA